jgi:hypothetical protein
MMGVGVPRASPRPWRVARPPRCPWGSAWPRGSVGLGVAPGVGGDGGDGLLGVLGLGLAVGLGGGGAVVLRVMSDRGRSGWGRVSCGF